MSKTLYIHIGSHKTGTTSIQHMLFESTDLLINNGFNCFHKQIKGRESLKGSVNSWFKGYDKPIDNGLEILYKDILAKEMSKLEGDVIISSEQFSYVFKSDELVDFKKELDKYFDKIIIIVYLRRQDSQIISHHQQSAYRFFQYSSKLFGNEPVALPSYKKHFDLYLDYSKKLSMWSNVFGGKNFIIRNFENLYKNDAVFDFFHLFNIDDITPVKLNSSKGFEKAKVGLLMNEFSIHRDHHLSYVIQNSVDDSSQMLPSKKSAKTFYERYKDSNYKLNKEFNISENEFIFSEDFSKYPDESGDTWDEESANRAISNIIDGVNQAYGSVDLNNLVNAAIKLEKTDLKLSFELLKIVSKLIPSNKLVNDKLYNYKKALT